MNAIRKEIYKHILTKIADNELNKGDRIPTEMELAGEFKTNRMNAHLAVKRLEKEGIVKRNKRQGTIVAKHVEEFDVDGLKTMASNLVYVMASPPDKRFNIHWNESALLDFETKLNKDGFRVFLLEFPHEPELLRERIEEISRTDSKALVLFPDHGVTDVALENLEVFERFRGDIIMLDRGGRPLDAFPYHTIGYNSFEEGAVAGRYLKERGFRRVVFFGFRIVGSLAYWVQQRYEGLRFALKGHCEPEIHLTDGRAGAARAAIDFLKTDSGEKPVFVAANDETAARIIDEAKMNGFDSPDNFFLIGFNNVIDFRSYNLTSVASAIDKIGIVLAEMVSRQLPLSQPGTQMRISLKSRVIERATC